MRSSDAGTGRWKKLLLLGIFAGGLVAFFALGGAEWLSFDALRENRETLLAYTERNREATLAAAVAVYALAVALSIPGASVLSLAMGFLFGRWLGTLAIVIGATVGATAVFLAARYLFADAARRRMGPRAQKIARGFGEEGFSYLLFLRLVPLFPFWLVNLVPAFAPIGVRTYVLATAIGILPGTFVYANLGESLGRLESADQLLSVEILLALGLLAVLSLVPILVKKFRTPQTTGETP